MMSNLSVNEIGKLYYEKQWKFKQTHPDDFEFQEQIENLDKQPITFWSKLIISEDSYWNMIKNIIVLGIFICYSIFLPLYVAYYKKIEPDAAQFLMFDIIFIFDRFSDMFVEYINKKGLPEKMLLRVLMHNFNSWFIIEILLTSIPFLPFMQLDISKCE